MGFWSRLRLLFRAKANTAITRAEDPREMLDYSYERQLQLLQEVKRASADVVAGRKRIELQAQQLQRAAAKLESQARQALSQGKEDLAREALRRRAAIGHQLDELRAEHAQLVTQETQLLDNTRRLQTQVDAFRTRKETMKASYTAAEARTKVGEAVSGLSKEMQDISLAVSRAEDKTAQMQARAGALDELLASGALEDPTRAADNIQAELDRTAADSVVEAELRRLKSERGETDVDVPLELPARTGADLFTLPRES